MKASLPGAAACSGLRCGAVSEACSCSISLLTACRLQPKSSRKVRLSFQILLIVVALIGLLMILIRTAPMPVARWHIDPETAARPDTPNVYLMRDGDGDAPALHLAAPPAEIASALDRIMDARPLTTLLAGGAADGFVTYIARTPVFRFPDAVSIRLSATANGTRVSIFSRSGFGRSDLGANRARVRAIVADLSAAIGPNAP